MDRAQHKAAGQRNRAKGVKARARKGAKKRRIARASKASAVKNRADNSTRLVMSNTLHADLQEGARRVPAVWPKPQRLRRRKREHGAICVIS